MQKQVQIYLHSSRNWPTLTQAQGMCVVPDTIKACVISKRRISSHVLHCRAFVSPHVLLASFTGCSDCPDLVNVSQLWCRHIVCVCVCAYVCVCERETHTSWREFSFFPCLVCTHALSSYFSLSCLIGWLLIVPSAFQNKLRLCFLFVLLFTAFVCVKSLRNICVEKKAIHRCVCVWWHNSYCDWTVSPLYEVSPENH